MKAESAAWLEERDIDPKRDATGESLFNALDDLDGAVDVLIDKLELALIPASPQPDRITHINQEVDERSVIAGRAAKAADTVRSIRARIHDLIGRIDL